MKALNPKLNAYITITEKEALQMAQEADIRLASEKNVTAYRRAGGLKDIFNTEEIRTTCASPILKNFIPPYDATVVTKLKEAGLVLLGKQNMDEFACGAQTDIPVLDQQKSWDMTCVAGGSSGGSAAAVAADLGFYFGNGYWRFYPWACVVLRGGWFKSDIRACFRSGVTAMASSWDTIAPLQNCY